MAVAAERRGRCWQVTGDGEATYFEGAALIATYVILAVFTLHE